MRHRPMTHTECLSAWRLDGEINGHSFAQTVGYVSECMDLADDEAALRSLPNVLSPHIERPSWLRRKFARS